MPTLALVDDDKNIVTSLRMFFEAEGFDVRSYYDGQSALDELLDAPPDIAVFDIKMPKMDGMELLRRLRKRVDFPVIFLTSKDEEIDEVISFNIGADDFVRKPCSNRLLLERVKAVLRRAAKSSGEVMLDNSEAIIRGRLSMDPNRYECSWAGQNIRLTVTEFLILQSLAEHPGFVKNRDQLMDAAYDEQIYVDDRTIDSHIKRLRKKFKAVDREFDAIETLYGIGYRYTQS